MPAPIRPSIAGAPVTAAPASFILLLAALTATGPTAMQIFLPALPLVQRGLHTSTGIAQLALSLPMLAQALSTLMTFAAAASQIVGIFTGTSAWPMLICMLCGGFGALVALLCQPRDATTSASQ